ncbi:MAG TPA: hypothetical protein PKD53_29575, partial [Chloroflexaceae bacterium]|nr:hypothetical protein [Chloroflexaceae bacterium]
MKHSIARILGTALMGLALLASPQPAAPAAPAPFLDPAVTAGTGEQAVIVTAGSAAQAGRAVEAVGGAVTSELWLINAVAALVPEGAVRRLAAQPGVSSVVANRAVRSSEWDGWVTDLPLPAAWGGRPDVQPTDDPSVWR